MSELIRTPVRKKAKQVARLLKQEYPDYNYLREVFRHVRKELGVEVAPVAKLALSYVPSEDEICKYYKAVWQSQKIKHVIMIKTLLYTGVRVSELVRIKIEDIDYEECQIRIVASKRRKERRVPFPNSFKEILAIYVKSIADRGGKYMFESAWKRAYTDRAIRKILEKYTKIAGIEKSISPEKLRHFLFSWLKKQGIDEALQQPYSGHKRRLLYEMEPRLSMHEAQKEYDHIIKKFPI